MRKAKSLSGKKVTAWKWFSKYIKLHGAITTVGDPNFARCYTCKKIFPISEIDCGHMIPGRTNGILFDGDICEPQCRQCNRLNNGEQQMFKFYKVIEHSEEWYELKKQARRSNCELSDMELEAIAKEYRERYHKLLKGI